MNSIFTDEGHQEILDRINKLNESSEANWGKMNVSQMLKHCQGPLEVAIGSKQLNTKIGFMKKLIFKAFKPTMYNDKPWKQHLPTARDYVVTEQHNFDAEKEQLKKVLDEFSVLKTKTNWPKHPFFGSFTTEQWGKLQYKHLDHHLTQFGV